MRRTNKHSRLQMLWFSMFVHIICVLFCMFPHAFFRHWPPKVAPKINPRSYIFCKITSKRKPGVPTQSVRESTNAWFGVAPRMLHVQRCTLHVARRILDGFLMILDCFLFVDWLFITWAERTSKFKVAKALIFYVCLHNLCINFVCSLMFCSALASKGGTQTQFTGPTYSAK